MINVRHAEQMRRYRERLKAKATPTTEGAEHSRGAPETRVIVQSLATAVRKMAAAVRRNPTCPEAEAYQRLMNTAKKALLRAGYDREESIKRLTFYVLPPAAKSKRRKADIEQRYWEQPPVAGIPRVTQPES
ncbi:hypothetical protein [Aureimonas sp. SA4125]|uniref:hypothetical protein n=1 Tax=Aureimonas sp. SA4125 TaxID=2826993 RepID=UPI001CC634A1|nr:hypothetical protein [Aureimonas sp. SA4125]